MTIPIPASQAPARLGRGAAALAWWKRYCDPAGDGDPETRARLRRCRSAVDALSIRPAIRLAHRIGIPRDVDDWRLTAGLDLARVLAHVTIHDPALPPMRAAGWKTFPGDRRESEAGDDRPRLSEVRFRRLLEAAPGEELVVAFSRLVILLDRAVSVTALAEDFLSWGDRTKRRWAFDYYAAGVAAPDAIEPSIEDTDL